MYKMVFPDFFQRHECVRQSNMELLRMFAMFMVLVVHADFFSLGEPSPEYIRTEPSLAFGSLFIQSLSIVGVDTFVLILGLLSSFGAFIPSFLPLSDNIASLMLGRMYTYTNPLVITASVFLLLYFSKFRFQNRFVNWCGVSCFAVFLIHANPNFVNHFKDFIIHLNQLFPTYYFILCTFLFLLVVFFGSILIDKVRILLWEKLWGKIKVLSNKVKVNDITAQ